MACFFNRHRWLLIDRIYTPPVATDVRGASIPVDFAEKVLMGYTTLIFQCQDCRAIRTHGAVGRTSMEEAGALKEPS